jgi:glyoxylase-like metal-dependent hydrolase (beta-lactamase superfamily II)
LKLIDLNHLGLDKVIGCYLLETEDGPALHDCGPASALPHLREALAGHGLEVGDLRHLLLSHIHLDHAGAAGVLVRENPALRVHVSEIGAPHLVDPSRLDRSARRLYGDDFDRLWGELAPIPEENVAVAGPRVLDFDCFPSPGHASHHVCYLRDGVLYAGDAAGVRIQPGRFVLLPTPPPDIDLEGWVRTLDEIERREPEQLALIHFGVADDPGRHIAELRHRIERWGGLVGDGTSEEEWTASVIAEIRASGEGRIEEFDVAMPLTQSYAGLKRYWDKKAEAA